MPREQLALWVGLVVLAAIGASNASWVRYLSGVGPFDPPPLPGLVGRGGVAVFVDIVAAALFVAVAWRVSRDSARRIVSAAIVGGVALVSMILDLGWLRPDGEVDSAAWPWPLLASGLLLLAWLVLRERSALAYLSVPMLLLANLLLSWSAIGTKIFVALGHDGGWAFRFFIQLQALLVTAAFGVIAAWLDRGEQRAPDYALPRVADSIAGGASAGPIRGRDVRGSWNPIAVVAFALSFTTAIGGVVCGHIALSQVKRTGERGRGLAIAALVISYLSIALVVVVAIFLVAATSSLG